MGYVHHKSYQFSAGHRILVRNRSFCILRAISFQILGFRVGVSLSFECRPLFAGGSDLVNAAYVTASLYGGRVPFSEANDELS